jgi:hypothetical protein
MTLQLRRNAAPIQMRNYGRIVQDMIAYAASLAPGLERDSLEVYIAQCMRQRNMTWNRDQEAGLARVKEDILRLSKGQLRCESAAFERMMAQPNSMGMGQRKKKKSDR